MVYTCILVGGDWKRSRFLEGNSPARQCHTRAERATSKENPEGLQANLRGATPAAPAPKIDGTLWRKRILTKAQAPQTAILLLDLVLGCNASRDPVGDLLDAIVEARQTACERGGHLTVVASICGIEGDAQDLGLQARMMREAGALVFQSNARAAALCSELLKRR